MSFEDPVKRIHAHLAIYQVATFHERECSANEEGHKSPSERLRRMSKELANALDEYPEVLPERQEIENRIRELDEINELEATYSEEGS